MKVFCPSLALLPIGLCIGCQPDTESPRNEPVREDVRCGTIEDSLKLVAATDSADNKHVSVRWSIVYEDARAECIYEFFWVTDPDEVRASPLVDLRREPFYYIFQADSLRYSRSANLTSMVEEMELRQEIRGAGSVAEIDSILNSLPVAPADTFRNYKDRVYPRRFGGHLSIGGFDDSTSIRMHKSAYDLFPDVLVVSRPSLLYDGRLYVFIPDTPRRVLIVGPSGSPMFESTSFSAWGSYEGADIELVRAMYLASGGKIVVQGKDEGTRMEISLDGFRELYDLGVLKGTFPLLP